MSTPTPVPADVRNAEARVVATIDVDGIQVDIIEHQHPAPALLDRPDTPLPANPFRAGPYEAHRTGTYALVAAFIRREVLPGKRVSVSGSASRAVDPNTLTNRWPLSLLPLAGSSTVAGCEAGARRFLRAAASEQRHERAVRAACRTLTDSDFAALSTQVPLAPGDQAAIWAAGRYRVGIVEHVSRHGMATVLYVTPTGRRQVHRARAPQGEGARFIQRHTRKSAGSS